MTDHLQRPVWPIHNQWQINCSAFRGRHPMHPCDVGFLCFAVLKLHGQKTRCACGVSPNTITPEVSLSKRCTNKASGNATCKRVIRQSAKCAPRPGTDNRPAGLSTTTMSASSCRMTNGPSGGLYSVCMVLDVSDVRWVFNPPHSPAQSATHLAEHGHGINQ